MATEKKLTTFEKLKSINVNEHVERKDGLTYLSWAWAWSAVKTACPDATYELLPTEYDEDLGFMCHTKVTIAGESLEMWLPVMDGKNKSMKKKSYTYSTKYGEKTVEAATTFDINKTLMRCLVKNLAMFGLGLYIYAGEDLPETAVEVTEIARGKNELVQLEKGTEDWNSVVKYVTAHKNIGIQKIGQQLTRKYTISPELKNEIANLLKD
jgi:hypothetical protein